MKRQIHLFDLGVFIYLALNLFGRLLHFIVVYGYLDAAIGKVLERVRFSSSPAELAVIGKKELIFGVST